MTVQDQITRAANSAGVPSWLALAIAQQESDFDQNAVGSSGEIGVFQLLPSTAAQLGVDPHDLTQNIAGGVAYIGQMLRAFGGDVQKAAAAFNCGPTCVANAVAAGGATWGTHIPASTQSYVASVTGSPVISSPAASPDATTPPVTALPTGGVPTLMTSSVIGTSWEPWALGAGGLLLFLVLRGIGQRA